MAPSAKFFFLLLLLTLLSSLQIHARDPQLFNKIPSNNAAKETQVVVPNSENTLNSKQEQEPNFIPEDENGGYGLYGHESGQLPPSTTTTTNPNGVEPFKTTTTNLPYNSEPQESYPKYLPKNYNTHAYVTEPEGYRPGNNYNNNFYNGQNTHYNNEQESFGETKLLGNSYTKNPSNYRNNYYNNEEQQGMSDTRYNNYNKNNNYYNNYNGVNTMNGVEQKQGMSDTRFLEDGKYFYDVSMEQNFNHGPYGANNRGYYGNNYNENSFEHNNNYQNQEQFQNFQNEEDLP